jgi:lipid II:glycine glycyltransferase (peptidoglycan interpeptide bridge formation enzyme)
MKVYDVRQSDQWGQFLSTLGWKTHVLSNGSKVRIIKTFLGSMAKFQRPDTLTKENLVELDEVLLKNKCLFVKVEPALDQDLSVLKEHGYVPSTFPLIPTTTIYMDLKKSEKELWDAVSHSGKYSITRAQREGAKIECIRNPKKEDLEKFYKVLHFTGKMKKFYVPPIKQLFDQASAFGENAFIVFVYNKNEEVEGAKMYMAYKNFVLYISGGTTKIGRDTKGGYELMWKSILYFKSLDYDILDLEGKDDPRFPGFTKAWGGFSHFKEKFNGEVITFPLPYLKYYNPIIRFISTYSPLGM